MTWKKNVTSLFLLFSNERCFFAIVCLWRSRSRSMSMHFHSKVKIAASGKDQPITILHIVWKWLKMSVNCVTAISEFQKFSKKKLIVRQIIKTFFENFTEFWESYRISIILQNLEIFLIHLAMLGETFSVIFSNTVELETTSGSHGTFLFFAKGRFAVCLVACQSRNRFHQEL